jgi:hypothetical protein
VYKVWSRIKYELSPLVPPGAEYIVPYLAILFIGFVLVSCGHSPSLDDSWLWKAYPNGG